MADGNQIVGKNDCTPQKIVKILLSSESFLDDKWVDVALDLKIEIGAIKKWKQNLRDDKDTLKFVLTNMLHKWVDKNGSKAYLKDLLLALISNGMKALSEHLEKSLGCLSNQSKIFGKFPQTLENFFNSESKSFTIISTPDTKITCDKIRENCEDAKIFEVKGFLLEASKDRNSVIDTSSPYVITVIKIDEINRVFKAATSFPVKKLLIITGEPKKKLKELEGKFKIVKDEMEWDDLSPFFQFEIEERLKKQVGMSIQNLSETICGQILVNLINKVELKLFKNTIPEELLVSYYIPRIIIERNMLDKEKLFGHKSVTDIFLFTGIEKIKLRSHVKLGMTGISSELLNSRTIMDLRFIVLQNPNHFPVICRNNPNKSFHWIKFKDEEFHWVKTSGQMKSIQEMTNVRSLKKLLEVEKAEEEIDEEVKFREAELVDKVALNDETRVVCLSDTPGMGKSVLLAKIGKKLKDIPDSSKIVIFLPISDLIKSIKELDSKSLESALQDLACGNSLEKEIISERLTSSALEIELLLDGFDEVESDRINFAFKLLQFIKGFNSIRLWVGTRPQYLEKLEQKLNTIGYNIKPFNKSEQIKFLKKFFTSKNKDLDENLLKIFARKILETLSSTTARGTRGSAMEVEIAGIPLQCHMLAQIYEESAALFCSSSENTENNPILLDINSVTVLYTSLVENKFQKYQKTYSGRDKLDKQTLYSMHSKLALQLIFPDWFDTNISHLFKETGITEQLLNVGLLEKKSIDSNTFIHRTYAEYFCAHFVAKMIINGDFLNEAFINFFYSGFLNFANPAKTSDKEYNLKFIFRNFVPCYFLDCFIFNNTNTSSSVIAPIKYNSSLPTIRLPPKDFLPDEIQIFIAACSNNNFESLFNLFADHPNFEKFICDIIDEDYLLYSIKTHGFEMYKIVHGHFKNHSRFSSRLSSRALHVAVKSVDPPKLEYFLNVEGLFDKLLGNPGFELNRLFKVYFDYIWNVDELSNAIEVISLLVEFEKRVTEADELECNSFGLQKCRKHWRVVLLIQHVDYRIGVKLINWGADIPADERYKFLQMHSRSSDEYLQYFQALLAKYPIEEIKPLIKIKNSHGLTPLAQAFENKVQFSRECMEMWKEAGVDFTEVFNNAPLFLLAIQSGNGREVLQFMIENGVDVHWRKEQANKGRSEVRTYLEYAAEAGNVDAIQLLVNEHGMNINGVKENLGSPLDNLILNWKDNSESYFRGAQELWKLGGRFKINSPDDLRRIVSQHRDLFLLRFALHCALEVNKKDMEGNNLLHWVIEKWRNDKAIELILEAGADLSAKNEEGLIPLDLAVRSEYWIEILRLLKPSKNFKWSCVSPIVSFKCFEHVLCQSARIIYDKDEFLSLLEEFIQRSTSENREACLNNLFLNGSTLSPVQFQFITEYFLNNEDLFQLWTTFDISGCTALHHAIKNIKGIEEKTLKILHKTVDFHVKDKKGKSLLFYAVEGGQSPDFLEVLSKYGGGDFQDIDIYGQSLLHALAATLDNPKNPLEIIKFLLEKRVDPNWMDEDGNTPLHCSVNNNINVPVRFQCRLDFAKALLEGGANPKIKNKKNETFYDLVLTTAGTAQLNDARQIFRLILDFTKESIIFSRFSLNDIVGCAFNKTYFGKEGPSDEEFIYFTEKIFELKFEAQSNWCDDYFPLIRWKMFLTQTNFHLVVENLIKNGQTKTFFSLAEYGMPALHHLVSEIKVEERTLKLLQENGVDFGVKDENGWSLLFHVISRGTYKISLKYFKLLEKYGWGNVRDKDKSGKSLLHVAVNEDRNHVKNSNVVEYLLVKVGLDPNEVDNEGNTPLHILLQNWTDRLDTILKVQGFVEAGANIFLENSRGETVTDLAESVWDWEDGEKDYFLSILSASKTS